MVALDAQTPGSAATSARVENRRGAADPLNVLVAFMFVATVLLIVHGVAVDRKLDALAAHDAAAETKLRAVTWLAERRLDPDIVRADSLRRACYAQVARNGGADCGL